MVFAPPGPLRNQLPAFDTVPAAGATTNLRIPTGPTYDRIDLVLTDAAGGRTAAEIASDISRLVLRVGSEVKWDLTGAQVAYLMAYWQPGTVSPANNGVLPLYFARPWMEPVAKSNVNGQPEPNFSNNDGPAYGMYGQSNFTLEITWDAASGCTGIVAFASTRAGTALGKHITLLPHRSNLGGAGIDEVQDIKRDPARGIVCMHIEDANVTEVEVRADDSTIYRLTAALAGGEMTVAGRGVSANYFPVAFDQRNRFNDTLPETMTDLRVRPTFGVAPGDYTIIMERIENSTVQQVQQSGR